MTVAVGNPFRGLIRGCVLVLMLAVAFDLVVLVGYRAAAWARPAALIGAALALAAGVALLALVVTGQCYSQRSRQLLAGDYLVRWHYAQGEWQQFVTQERTRSTRIALVFLPLMLGIAALLALLSQVSHDPFLEGSIPVFLLLAAGFLVVLVAGRPAFARRMHLTSDTYIGPLGVLRPDSYLPLHGTLYHLAAAEVVHGRPSQLRLRLRLGRAGGVLAFLGNAPTEWEVRVPVPYGHEAEAAQVAAQLRVGGAKRS
jgi:uncharacterized membrane protein (DUF485 family)